LHLPLLVFGKNDVIKSPRLAPLPRGAQGDHPAGTCVHLWHIFVQAIVILTVMAVFRDKIIFSDMYICRYVEVYGLSSLFLKGLRDYFFFFKKWI